MKKYETIVEKDENNELVIPFDEELMSEIGWEIGDIIQWTENENGSFTLTRVVKDEQSN
jgi:adenine specific DNA methylase Mod